MSSPTDHLSAATGVPIEIGEVLQGKYRVDRPVGVGGMAAVYAGRHLELDQPIAIKLLREGATPDALHRFLSEARAAARLDSPYVARVLDVGTAETKHGGVRPFIVMELLEGLDLDGLLAQRGSLPVHEAVEYVWQACSGVAEAHAAGIIHRDLKPGNLFLTVRRDGSPVIKLLDFGISKNVSSARKTSHAVTEDREVMGSPGYMSPEQVRSTKNVDPRTDVWSLGVILHELLTGTNAFTAETTADTFVAILHSPPRPIASIAPHVPEALVDIVSTCLQKRAADRYTGVDALAAALAPFRSPTPLVVADLAPRTLDVPTAEAGVSVQTLPAHPSRRRGVLAATATLAAVGLVLVVSFGLATLRRSSPDSNASPAPLTAPTPPPSAQESTPPPEPPAPPAEVVEEELEPIELPALAPPAKTHAPKAVRRTKRPAKPAKALPKPSASVAPRSRTPW